MFQTVRLLLPALIPSWRFFDEITASPRIEVALGDDTKVWTEFRPRPQALSIWSILARLVHNPGWNDTLYLVSVSERIAERPNKHSIQGISDRIRAELTKNNSDVTSFKFRIVFVHKEENSIVRQIVFESDREPVR